jgi:hypothetical protein
MVQIEYLPIVLTGLSITASILYYTNVLRNANRTRESQLFTNIYNQSFANPKFLNAVRKIQLKSQTIHSHKDLARAYDWFNPEPEDPEFLDAWNYVGSFFEGLGVFVREGLIPIRLIALTMSGVTQSVWSVQSPYLEDERKRFGATRLWSEWEYLYNELVKYMEEHPELAT